MKSARFALGVAVAGLTFAMTAFAGEGTFAPASVVRPDSFSMIHALAQPDRFNAISALKNFDPIPGPAQVRNGAWRYRVRTLSVSTSSLSFGSVNLNSVSTQSIRLSSTGTASVTVSAVTVAGAGFSIAGPALPLTLSPGQAATVTVSFDPKVAGAVAGTVSISSNSYTGSTTNVSLSGTGISVTANPVLSLSTSSLNFGSVAVGTPITQAVTLKSTGTSAVTVSAASLVGAGFTISGATFPVTLNPNIAVTVQVQFDPTVVGTASGTLKFTSNSSTGSTSLVALSGSGTTAQHQVTLSWAAPASSPVTVSGYNVYRAASGGTAFQRLNTSAQTTYADQNVVAGSSYNYYVTSVDSAGTESTPSNQVTVTVP